MERGAHHQKALCVVAARLAERAWVVLSRGHAYEIRDVDGTPITPAEARCLVRKRYTVSEEVRRRRRSRKSAREGPSSSALSTCVRSHPSPGGQPRRPSLQHHPSRRPAGDQGVPRYKLLTGRASIGSQTCR